MEIRKQREREYHNLKRDEISGTSEHLTYLSSQRKWYSINRRSRNCYERWLSKKCYGKRVLDYGCGNGQISFLIAKMGASEVFGIDISDFSIENAKMEATKQRYDKKTIFRVMDAEDMEFKDSFFDVVLEAGVLHHLDLKSAYLELARVLKPDGEMICAEALGHNPAIGLYRRKTPHLRTEWEANHILKKKDIEMAKQYFNKVKVLGFFHLASIVAVPFRNLPIFDVILSTLEAMDSVLLKLPILKWQAWQIVFVLGNPKNKK